MLGLLGMAEVSSKTKAPDRLFAYTRAPTTIRRSAIAHSDPLAGAPRRGAGTAASIRRVRGAGAGVDAVSPRRRRLPDISPFREACRAGLESAPVILRD